MRFEVCEIDATLPFDPEALATSTEARRIIATDDYLRLEVADLCSAAIPSLLVRPAGGELWIGPLLHTEASICYDCLRFYLGLRRWRPAAPPEPPSPLLDLPALPDLRSAIAVIDSRTRAVEHVPFAARVDCPRCRLAADSPERRIAILSHPLSGIVENVRSELIPGSSLHVALGAVLLPPEIRRARGLAPLVAASGSGWDEQSARRVLTLEAAERYSTEFDGSEDLVTGSPIEADQFPISDFLQFSETQYSAIESGGEPQAPPRLPADRPIAWAVARSLVDGGQIPVPAGCVYLDYSFEGEPWYCVADTCGCAAADSYPAAIRHALLESIERDALAIWWYNRIPRPLIRPGASESPELETLRRVLETHGRSLSFFDLTHDIGVPVIAAISAGANGSAIYLGAAADLSAVRACERAARELLQFWYWDRVQERIARRRRAWIERGSYADCPFLDPRRAPDEPVPPSGDAGGVQRLADMLLARGLRAHFVDLTRPAIGLPAVRAVVPGLRHQGRRFAPGRLYDVPVRLGWLPSATPEQELNPYPVPL